MPAAICQTFNLSTSSLLSSMQGALIVQPKPSINLMPSRCFATEYATMFQTEEDPGQSANFIADALSLVQRVMSACPSVNISSPLSIVSTMNRSEFVGQSGMLQLDASSLSIIISSNYTDRLSRSWGNTMTLLNIQGLDFVTVGMNAGNGLQLVRPITWPGFQPTPPGAKLVQLASSYQSNLLDVASAKFGALMAIDLLNSVSFNRDRGTVLFSQTLKEYFQSSNCKSSLQPTALSAFSSSSSPEPISQLTEFSIPPTALSIVPSLPKGTRLDRKSVV